MEGGLSHYPMGGHTLMADKGMAGVRVAGFGFRAAAKTESLYDAFIKAAEDKPIMALAAPRDKIDHPHYRRWQSSWLCRSMRLTRKN